MQKSTDFKRRLGWLTAIIILASSAYYLPASDAPENPKLPPKELEPSMVPRLGNAMSYAHLTRPKFDKKLIKNILKKFLTRLDPTHTAYLQKEADAKTDMTDEVFEEVIRQVNEGNLSYFVEWIKEFQQKQLARSEKYALNLKNRIEDVKSDYNIKNYKDIDFEKFPKTNEERERRSLLRAKYHYRMYIQYLEEKEAFEYALQTTMKQIVEKNKFKPKTDAPKIFMKAYMGSLDPHSEYFDVDDIENFESSMAREFAGIGVQIRGCPLGTQVIEVIKGGPAIKSKQLEKDDQIIGVDGAVIAGESLSKIVKRIKGKKGTKVNLTVKKGKKDAEGNPKIVEVILKRDTIKLSEIRVTDKLYQTKSGPIGVIRVQSFYHEVAKDVKERIEKLSKEKPLKGLVLDLRGNSGGLLREAIRMTGLFISEGPVVAERDSDGNNNWTGDTNADVTFAGPLAVLINQYSASASEIVAGALQDYGRGILVGGTQTHGKGTVQRIIDLRERGVPGQFKLTIRQYYLPSGDSVQCHGVQPDIKIPGLKLQEKYLEKADKNAIAWGKIDGALTAEHSDKKRYWGRTHQMLDILTKASKKRSSANKDFEIYRKLMALDDDFDKAIKILTKKLEDEKESTKLTNFIKSQDAKDIILAKKTLLSDDENQIKEWLTGIRNAYEEKTAPSATVIAENFKNLVTQLQKEGGALLKKAPEENTEKIEAMISQMNTLSAEFNQMAKDLAAKETEGKKLAQADKGDKKKPKEPKDPQADEAVNILKDVIATWDQDFSEEPTFVKQKTKRHPVVQEEAPIITK